MKRKFFLIPILLIGLAMPLSVFSYESLYPKTPVGEIQLKTLPARVALQAASDKPYFDKKGGNGLFMTLFRYIDANDVKMTIPVESDVEATHMRFFVGKDAIDKDLADKDGITVINIPEMQVISVGLRGGYSEKTYARGLDRIAAWLKANPTYEAIGDPVGVYWNGPFVPGLFKHSEVNQRVRLRAEK